jgi:hypothetical protein
MTLLADRIWLPGDIKTLAGAAQDARFRIEKRVLGGKVAVDGDAIGWGQYLDEVHHSASQWGLLGTSAGYQVLARGQLEGTPVQELSQVRLLLPPDVSDVNALHPAVQRKAGPPKHDLGNIIRLASIAEALGADKPGTVIHAPHPSLVDHIFSLARNGQSWNPRSAQPGYETADGHAVTTAFVLHALRRYEDDHTRFRPIRVWLARQLLNDAMLRARPDYLALVGLALTAPEWDSDNPEDVRAALTRCEEQLLAWRRRERTLVINRPLFEGYQLGATTDYLIFNPELMAALLFLRSDNPRPARRFVAAVTRELSRNVQANHGFEGQLGMVPVVDQEWASRVLQLFAATYKDKSRRHLLLPGRLTSRLVRWGLFVACVLILAAALAALGVDLETGVLVFIAGAIVSAAALILQGRHDDE